MTMTMTTTMMNAAAAVEGSDVADTDGLVETGVEE